MSYRAQTRSSRKRASAKRLEKTLSENVEEISKLSLEINRLDSQTIPLTLGKTESIWSPILGLSPLGMAGLKKKCTKCGNIYILNPLAHDLGLCSDCESKLKKPLGPGKILPNQRREAK